jgi:hypothetical protein
MSVVTGKQLGLLVELLPTAAVQFKEPAGSTATVGFVRLPYGDGTTSYYVVSDNGVGVNYPILSRVFNELYIGSYLDDFRVHAKDQILFEVIAAGKGYIFDSYLGDCNTAFRSDDNKTMVRGLPDVGHDGTISQLKPVVNTVVTTPDTAITHLVLQNNATTMIQTDIVAWDTVTNEFAAFKHTWTFSKIAGVVTASTGVQPAAVDAGHSAGAVGVNVNYFVNGDGVDIRVTPWTTNSTHWTVLPLQTVNANLF